MAKKVLNASSKNHTELKFRKYGQKLQEVFDEVSKNVRDDTAQKMVKYINTLSPEANFKKMTL